MSSPIDAAIKEELLNLIKSVCVTFTTQYVKHYTIALVKKLEEDKLEEKSPYKLMEREPLKDDLKSGYLTKEGAIRKNWKKRWFVARYNYTVDYFGDEKASKKEKPKPKGTMSLAGYYVVENIGESLLKQVKDLAEKMGMDVSQLPKPKEYPELCFEVHHSRRRCYFIKAETQEDKDAWVEQFKTCCRNAWGLKNQDPVHVTAFHNAVRETRWELGRWGWWSYGGSEEQIISDLISDEIEYQTLGKIYGRITGSWMIRNAVRNQVLKTIDGFVSAGVTPAWKAMSKTVEELRPKITPTIQTLVDPIADAKKKVMDTIADAALATINPLLEKHVTPHLSKIMSIITSPVREGYDICYTIYEEKMKEFSEAVDLKNLDPAFQKLDWTSRDWWAMRPAREKVDVMYEPLWVLHEIFADLWPWYLIWKCHDAFAQRMDNAVYTFEVKLKEALEKDSSADKAIVVKIKDHVLEDYKHDATIHALEFYRYIIKAIVMPPFNATVIPACKALLEPIANTVPDPVKEFIDIMDMFDRVVNKIVDGAIDTVIKSGL